MLLCTSLLQGGATEGIVSILLISICWITIGACFGHASTIAQNAKTSGGEMDEPPLVSMIAKGRLRTENNTPKKRF